MARRFHRRERLSAMSEINVTPLIDLAFALLIIFMITAPLLEQSIRIDLPVETAKPQDAPAEQRFIAVSVDAAGQYYWDDEAVEWDELEARLDAAALEPTAPVVRVRADADIPYQRVVSLLDLVQQKGLTQISLDTVPQ